MRHEDAGWRETQRIRLDVNNVFGPNGLTPAELEAEAARAAEAIAAVQSRREALGWPLLPEQDVTPFEQFAAAHRDRIDTFVVLGIGGSALGNIAVQTAINGPFYNLLPREQRGWPRLLVLDNSDPELNAGALRMLDLRRTMFNVISKSGTTAETMASFLYFRQALVEAVGEEKLGDHIVLTTDPSSGFLRQIGQREGGQCSTCRQKSAVVFRC